MKSEKTSSHSRFPAKPGSTDPIHDAAQFKKDVAPHFVGQPQQQMQQGGGQEEPAQQGDSAKPKRDTKPRPFDQNVGGFG